MDRVRGVRPCLQLPGARFAARRRDREAIGDDNQPLAEAAVMQRKGLVSCRLLELLGSCWRVAVEGCSALTFPQPLQEQAVCRQQAVRLEKQCCQVAGKRSILRSQGVLNNS